MPSARSASSTAATISSSSPSFKWLSIGALSSTATPLWLHSTARTLELILEADFFVLLPLLCQVNTSATEEKNGMHKALNKANKYKVQSPYLISS